MRKTCFALALILGAYFFVAGQQLHLPGLHNDEAQEAGLPALQIASGVPVTAFRNVGIGARHFPLMVQDYIGALHVYITAPFVAVLGPSTTSVRLPSLLIGAVTLLLTFGFTRSGWGNTTGLLAAGLLALHPSFVFWSRQGTLIASMTLAFAMALLWMTTQWCKHGNVRAALAAGLLAGAGVYSKILFLWILGGMAGAALLLNLPRLLRARGPTWPRRPTGTSILATLAGFTIGVAPLLAFHAFSRGDALTLVGKMFSTGTTGWDQLYGRLDHFGAVMTAKNHFWYLGSSPGNPLWMWAFFLAALAIVAQATLRMSHARRGLALLLLLVLAVLMAPFTPTPAGLFPHHLALFAPVWTTVVAIGAAATLNLVRRASGHGKRHRSGALILIALGLTTLTGSDVFTDLHMHRALKKSGGEGPHSAAIHTLAEQLQRLQPTHTVALDWGISPQVRYLTAERIAPSEVFGYSPTTDAGFGERLHPFFQHPGTIYVLHTPDETIFHRRIEFAQEAASRG
ncbi:MAG: glycosyltransferase family 39 protein, partial [Anaerolineales bacterium]|nr:glycosyltransferase family 39 protein [Anaerolineales bacterium]